MAQFTAAFVNCLRTFGHRSSTTEENRAHQDQHLSGHGGGPPNRGTGTADRCDRVRAVKPFTRAWKTPIPSDAEARCVTMNSLKKKRHHFVSVTYLNGFCDDGGKIFAYRSDEPEKVLHLAPDEIGFEKYYYSYVDEDGLANHNRFEDVWSSMESHWPATMGALHRGEVEPEVVRQLYIFMGVMRTRVPAARDFHESAIVIKMRTEVKTLARIGKLPTQLRRYEHELDTARIAVNRQQTLATMSDDMKRFARVTMMMGFEIVRNDTAINFIASDNPVLYFDPSQSSHSRRPYEANERVELYFPLNKRLLLRGTYRLREGHMRPPRFRKLTDPSKVKAINREIARYAYRLLFASDRSNDRLAKVTAGFSPVLDAEVRHRGKSIEIYLQHKFGPRPALNTFRPDLCEEMLDPYQ